ncbi:sulfatase-like hydrolase/transferase [Candidatus Poribacteria bacterium]|nr:sulfatase-like hydrolase/transferase [Candidatus Poribacteria bacterium]
MNKKPNILFFFPDQLRPDWLGINSEIPVRTPNIDKIAQQGITFNRAKCAAPLCAPSRASLATGLRVHRCGVPDNGYDLPLDSLTYYQLMRNSGYRVGATGKTDLHKKTKWYGLDGWTENCGILGFTETVDQAGKWDAVNSGVESPQDPYMAYLHRVGYAKVHVDDYQERRRIIRETGKKASHASPLPTEHYTDEYCGRMALNMLKNFPSDSPWHLTVNFPSPHDPMDAPASWLERWNGVDFPLPHNYNGPMTPEDHQAVRRNYAAMIECLDYWCGQLITELQRRDELDNTFIVFSADHGEMLGDFSRWAKSTMRWPSVDVPMIISGPGVENKGRKTDAMIEVTDLAATFLEMAGLSIPEGWDSRSLMPIMKDEEKKHREFQISILNQKKMIADNQYKLIIGESDSPMLFDTLADPWEDNDIADDKPEEVKRLKDQFMEETNI